MSRSHHRRPPKRLCPRCGGHHYAWAEHTICNRCKREQAAENLKGPSLRELRQANQERLRAARP